MANRNKSWNLESFLDSFIHELDKARDTLAIKGVNKPLTYAVKELSMDLQLFPEFDGKEVRFTNAKSGDSGASKISIQLGSITDRQIRETTKQPITKDDFPIDEIEDIGEDTKESLKKIGVNSIKDLEQLETKNIAVKEVAKKIGKTDYSSLADKLKKARAHSLALSQQKNLAQERKNNKPAITSISLSRLSGSKVALNIEGRNLVMDKEFQPEALINEKKVDVIAGSPDRLVISASKDVFSNRNELKIALDPVSIIKFKIK